MLRRSPDWADVVYWALDLETGGLSPGRDPILAVGMVPIRDGVARLAEALVLGDIALCRFELADGGATVQLHQTTAQLQRGELVVGGEVYLQLDPAGLHIMPRRGLQPPH